MNQTYITVTATSTTAVSSPWWQPDKMRNPMQIGLQVVSTGSTSAGPAWSVDVTMDDPFGYFPNPQLNPGQPQGAAPGTIGGKVVTIFNSGSVGGWGNGVVGIANCFGTSGGSSLSLPAAIGGITQPIGALRLTVSSSAAGVTQTVVMTILQAGPR